MKLRVLGLLVLIVAFRPGCAFAQTAPLVSNPDPQQTTVIAKRPRVVFLDIPIVPMRKTINVRRVREGNLNLGSALDPWGKNVIYRINIAPEATISNTDSRLHV